MDTHFRRRILILNQATPFPRGYKQVEYLESHGTEYIDTEIYPGQSFRMVFRFLNKAATGNIIVGNMDRGDSNDFRFFNASNSCYFDMVSSRINGGRISSNIIYTLEIGNYYVKDLETQNIIVSGNVQDFSRRDYSIRITPTSSNIFYNFQYYEGIELIRDFVPCIRKSDNKPGMYDLVGSICPLTNTPFYINAGTGEFTPGPEV